MKIDNLSKFLEREVDKNKELFDELKMLKNDVTFTFWGNSDPLFITDFPIAALHNKVGAESVRSRRHDQRPETATGIVCQF